MGQRAASAGGARYLGHLDRRESARSRRFETTGGVFLDFLPVDRDEKMVVLHELGALRVDAIGAAPFGREPGET